MNSQSTFTVKDLLEMDIMQEAEIIAGQHGIQRIINKFNVIEVPDIIDWVDSGDFLLTTGYSFRENGQNFANFIEESIKKNIAGIGIKMKRYLDDLPAKIIEIAEKADFPIISLPFEMSFSDILIAGFSGIVNIHARAIYRIEEIQTQLIDVMLKGGNSNDIANILFHNFYENSIVIKDNIFDQVTIRCAPENYEFVTVALNSIDNQTFHTNQKKVSQRRIQRVYDEWNQQSISRVIIPIYYEDKDYGSIYLWEDKQLLTPVEISTIESSTSLVALNIYKNISLQETESFHVTEFMQNILSGKTSRFKEAMSRAYYFNFDPLLNYSLIAITFLSNYRENHLSTDNTDFIQHKREVFLRAIQYMHTNSLKKSIGAIYDDRIIFLQANALDDSASKVKRDIKLFTNKLNYFFQRENLDRRYIITVGSLAQKPEKLWKAYDEALRTVEMYKLGYEKEPVFYDDIGAFKLFTFDAIKQERYEFCQRVLGPLLEYDKQKGTDYVNTLEQYFRCYGNYVKLAENIFTHYNTAVYRVQRIMKILNVDLEDYNQRFELEIAIYIYRLYKNEA